MSKLQVLTVIYHETQDHFNMALKTWASFPEDAEITAVINKRLERRKYPSNLKYIENDENCLAKAWNTGLKEIFKDHDYAFVSGLDSIAPSKELMQDMIQALERNPKYGIISVVNHNQDGELVQHGDGSFSFFLISKKTFKDVGNFNEQYKPAYFEDCDYLERLWQKGYEPRRVYSPTYFHLGQGTLKKGLETKINYPVYMQRNLELFKKDWGKVPDHLPEYIRFN